MNVLRKVTDALEGKAPFDCNRSPQWQKARNIHLKTHPCCEACGSTVKVEVHHINPFHLYPEQELDPNNFVTLCENSKNGVVCHLLFGHLGDYKSFNDNVIHDVSTWKLKLENRP